MTIYNFNLGIGWASSGVEYAQAYRANAMRKNNQSAKFVFIDFFSENIEPIAKNFGYKDKEIIWLYQYFTDIAIAPTTFTDTKLQETFSEEPSRINKLDDVITYEFDRNNVVIKAYYDLHCKQGSVYKTELFAKGNLLQRDYYSYTKVYSEYFKRVEKATNRYQRRFFNEDGSIAYEELINGKQSLFIFDDITIYSKEELLVHMLNSMKLTDKDILIMDRSTRMGPQLVKGKGAAKLGVVIHAEHFNEPRTDNNIILWNNYYEYQFTNAKSIDFYITATEIQKEILQDQFKTHNKGEIKVYAIPVGSIDKLIESKSRKKHGIVTASRLAGEKHIDWMVRAVAKARKIVPDISLDIYGKGNQYDLIANTIKSENAEEYIHLMGHHKLDNVYKKYETYVSTSPSEGFGLTLLEAVGSGLSMIGFDVRYGPQTFIKNTENGFLVEFIKNDTEHNIDVISDAIVKMMSSDDQLKKMSEYSYKIAEKFLTKNVQEKWKSLEEEQISD